MRTESSSVSQSPPGEVDAADRAREEQVAGEELAVVVERDVPGRVAGHVDDLERDAGDRDLVAAGDGVRGVVRSNRDAAARRPRTKRLCLGGRPDLGAGSVGEGRDAADVVDVGVRDEDAGGASFPCARARGATGRVVARIDDRGFGAPRSVRTT